MTIRSLGFGTLLSLIALAVGCGGSEEASSSSSAGATGKVIIVGTNPDYPPMQFIDNESGEMVGFEVDLMRAIAEQAGFEMQWKNVDWKGIFGALSARDIDVIMSSATITEERKKTFAFSDPYYSISQRVVVRAEDLESITAVAQLDGRRIGVHLNTTGAILAEEKFPAWVRVTFDNPTLAFTDLLQGSVFGFIVDEPVAVAYTNANPDTRERLAMLPFELSREDYGMVLRKSDTELLEKINLGLQKVKEQGIDTQIAEKWFE